MTAEQQRQTHADSVDDALMPVRHWQSVEPHTWTGYSCRKCNA